MTACASCGKEVTESRGGTGIRSGRKVYHISCAPTSLLSGAVEEWDAILARGVEYFMDKYIPEASGLKGESASQLLGRFATTGRKMKAAARRAERVP